MFICKFCNISFDTAKKRASHYKAHPEWVLEKQLRKDIVEKEKKQYQFICGCGSKHKSDKTLLAHMARCNFHKCNQDKYLEDLKDQIMKLNIDYSILAIAKQLRTTKNKYFISRASIEGKIKKWGGILRSIRDTSQMITVIQNKCDTNILRYGGTGNPMSNGSLLIVKRDATMIEKYGSTNIFSSKWFKDEILNNDEFWVEKYGMTRSELISIRGKEVWDSYSVEERKNRCIIANQKVIDGVMSKYGITVSIFRSIINKHSWDKLSAKERLYRVKNYKLSNNSVSNLENNLLDTLATLFKIDRQKAIASDRAVKFYDGHIIDTNILLEINGDYWHANPRIFNATDILKYPGKIEMTAQEVWHKDAVKKNIAEYFGYKVIYLWEFDIHQNKENIIEFCLTKIAEEIYDEN